MSAVEMVEPPHEPEGTVRFDELYAGRNLYDDKHGMPLIHEMATQARKNEIEFLQQTRSVFKSAARAMDESDHK